MGSTHDIGPSICSQWTSSPAVASSRLINLPLLSLSSQVYVVLSYRLFQLTNTLKNAAVPGKDAFKVGVNAAVMTVSGFALMAVGSILSSHSRVVVTALA